MNALPWVMTQLLAGEHRYELESAATRRRLVATEAVRHERGRFLRRRRDV